MNGVTNIMTLGRIAWETLREFMPPLMLACGWLLYATLTDTMVVTLDAQRGILHPFSLLSWASFIAPSSFDVTVAEMVRAGVLYGLTLLAGASCLLSLRAGFYMLCVLTGYLTAAMGLFYQMQTNPFWLGTMLKPEGQVLVVGGVVLFLYALDFFLRHKTAQAKREHELVRELLKTTPKRRWWSSQKAYEGKGELFLTHEAPKGI